MNATKSEYGFYYEFGEHNGQIHILRVNQKTNEIKDFFLDCLDFIKDELRNLNNIHQGLTTQEVTKEYLPDLCLDEIHEWKEVSEEDFHKELKE